MAEQSKLLSFSVPTVRYESTATYENSQGQQFLIRVSGCNQSEVEQYTKNLYFFCEASTGESEELLVDKIFKTNEDKSTGLSTRTIEFSNNEVEKKSEDTKFFVELNNFTEENIFGKFQFEFRNEIPPTQVLKEDQPQIAFNSSNQAYIIKKSSGTVKANITVDQGSATFTLWEAPDKNSPENQWRKVDSELISVSANTPGRGTLSSPVRANQYFKIKVEGQTGTKYRIKGDWDIN